MVQLKDKILLDKINPGLIIFHFGKYEEEVVLAIPYDLSEI